MAKQVQRLSARKVETLAEPGMHADGNGLYLRITTGAKGGKRWVFLYRRPSDGKRCELGLGGSGAVSLAKARERAHVAREQVADGRDPREVRDASPPSAVPTFGQVADQLIADLAPTWKNEKHAAQWRMTLKEYAAPLRPMRVDAITTADVLACIKPHWQARPETADRLRGRIERVLNAAKAAGHRTGENPAAWRGHLDHLMGKRPKLTRGHHDAMAWEKVPAFVADLRQREGVAALALEFVVLSAARSGEVRGALWPEFDLAAKVWTIPAERMKAGTEHRVPLTPRMLAILETVKPLHHGDGLVFPGQRGGKPLSDMSLSAVLRRMKVADVTVHGFRSSFRDWAGSATSYPRELAEEALAHVIGSKVERAYRRADALERRREMMAAWEKFCVQPVGGNVLLMKRADGGY